MDQTQLSHSEDADSQWNPDQNTQDESDLKATHGAEGMPVIVNAEFGGGLLCSMVVAVAD